MLSTIESSFLKIRWQELIPEDILYFIYYIYGSFERQLVESSRAWTLNQILFTIHDIRKGNVQLFVASMLDTFLKSELHPSFIIALIIY